VKVTWLRVGALVINLLLVVYLVWSKRLFGVRGGKRAYEARLRTESFIEAEQAALAAVQQAQQAEQPTRAAERSIPLSEQPTRAAEQPRRPAEQPIQAAEESIPLSERPTVPDEKPLLPSEQPTVPVERPVFPLVPEAPRTAMLRVARRPEAESPVAQETPAALPGLPGPAPR
jgi:hypothetical protein